MLYACELSAMGFYQLLDLIHGKYLSVGEADHGFMFDESQRSDSMLFEKTKVGHRLETEKIA
jgi:hypothetical protein